MLVAQIVQERAELGLEPLDDSQGTPTRPGAGLIARIQRYRANLGMGLEVDVEGGAGAESRKRCG